MVVLVTRGRRSIAVAPMTSPTTTALSLIRKLARGKERKRELRCDENGRMNGKGEKNGRGKNIGNVMEMEGFPYSLKTKLLMTNHRRQTKPILT